MKWLYSWAVSGRKGELSHLDTGPAIGETAFGHEIAGRRRPGKNLFPKRPRIVCKYAISWNYIGRTASANAEAMMEAGTKNTATVLDTKAATVLDTKAAAVLDTKAATVLESEDKEPQITVRIKLV